MGILVGAILIVAGVITIVVGVAFKAEVVSSLHAGPNISGRVRKYIGVIINIGRRGTAHERERE